MATLTDIANLALDTLGEKAIEDIDGTGSVPELLARNMAPAIREAEASFRWSELVAQESVEPETEQSADGLYRYGLPEDCLRVLSVEADGGALEYRLEGAEALLVSAGEAVRVVFLRYSDDPDEWGVQLSTAIVMCLAIRVCFALTQNPGIKQGLIAEYRQILRPETRRLQSYADASLGRRSRWGRWLSARRYS